MAKCYVFSVRLTSAYAFIRQLGTRYLPLFGYLTVRRMPAVGLLGDAALVCGRAAYEDEMSCRWKIFKCPLTLSRLALPLSRLPLAWSPFYSRAPLPPTPSPPPRQL